MVVIQNLAIACICIRGKGKFGDKSRMKMPMKIPRTVKNIKKDYNWFWDLTSG